MIQLSDLCTKNSDNYPNSLNVGLVFKKWRYKELDYCRKMALTVNANIEAHKSHYRGATDILPLLFSLLILMMTLNIIQWNIINEVYSCLFLYRFEDSLYLKKIRKYINK